MILELRQGQADSIRRLAGRAVVVQARAVATGFPSDVFDFVESTLALAYDLAPDLSEG